jgi:hypothetical protein
MERLKQKFLSRKFLVPIVTAVLVYFDLGDLDPEQVAGIAGLVFAFVLGESHVDATRIKEERATYVGMLESTLQQVFQGQGQPPVQAEPVDQ